MRLLLLVAVLLAASAAAQTPAAETDRGGAPAVAWLAAPVAGFGAGVLTAHVFGGEAVPTVLAFQAGYAAGVGVTLPLVADWAGGRGDAGRALRGALLGGGLGMATTGGLVLLAQLDRGDRSLGEGIALGMLILTTGTAVTVVSSPALALRGYRAGPVVLAAPDGRRALGAGVRIGL